MAGWQDKYKVVKIKPGRIVKEGKTIDLNNPNLPVGEVDALFKSGCSYLEEKNPKAKPQVS